MENAFDPHLLRIDTKANLIGRPRDTERTPDCMFRLVQN